MDENHEIIELDEEKIENLDKDLENNDENEKISKLNVRIKKIKTINIVLSIFSIFSLIVFIAIGISIYFVSKSNNPIINSIFNKNVNIASVSQTSEKNKIDMQKFANKLAFIDDVVNMLYYYDKDNKKIEDAMFAGYLSALGDKYAEYFPAKEFEEFTEKTTEGVYYGIGCLVTQDRKTKDSIVSSVYEDSPADKGGMKKGDIFISVNDTPVRGKPLDEIVALIKGEEGAERKIEVFRPSDNKNIILTCYCGKVDIKLINSEIYEGNIGYIDIDEFTGKARSQFKVAVDNLMKQDIKALILDCRGNAGGELMIVLSMIDYLIKDRDGRYTLNQKEEVFDVGKTLLVYIKEKDKIVDAAYAEDNHSVEIPMIVLTDFYTASAAELFTEALRDYKKATIVGTKTFGKGVVQNIIPYDDGSAIKFTVSEYFPPSGYGIDQVGIIPDYSLDYSGEEVKYDENKRVVVYEDDTKYILDRDGGIIEEIKIEKSTASEIDKPIKSPLFKSHTENLKIYDEDNEFLDADWYVELDDKYDDKQLLQALIILKDKLK